MTSGGRRRLGLLLAAAALSVTGCAATTDVEEAAATRTAPAATWFLDSGGVVPPTVSAPTTIAGFSPAIPRPGTFEVPRPAPYGVVPNLVPSPAPCGGYSTPKQINPGAVPGTGSATVSWMSDNRAEVTGYRVQAVAQTIVSGTQPEPVKKTAAQPSGCVEVSTTITGLTSGETYVFWLEEAVVDSTTSVTRLVQVGTSAPVTIG
jgi:hypothetical protein